MPFGHSSMRLSTTSCSSCRSGSSAASAVIDYFTNAHETMGFQPFEKPLEYYGVGDRVVISGDETCPIGQTGATHRAEWAWVHEGTVGKRAGSLASPRGQLVSAA